MIVSYMVAALLLSIVNLGILLRNNPRHTQSAYATMFLIMTVGIFGHLTLMLSTNPEEAVLANKIAYIGAIFIPGLFVLEEFKLCGFKISRRALAIPFIINIVILLLALTTGWNDIYYKGMPQLITHNGITDIQPEYGPAHILYNIMLGTYMLAGFIIFFYALFNKKNVSYKNLISMVAIGVFGIGTFLICRELGYDMLVMPAVYLIIEYVLLTINHRLGKYDIQSTIIDTLEFQNENVYLSVTKDLCYIGCNDIALHHFPTLKTYRVDSKVPDDEFGNILLKLIQKFSPQELCLVDCFQYGKKHYKVVLRNLHHAGKVCGYMFRIEDDTKMQRYIKLLDKYNSELANDVQTKDEHIQNIQEQMIVGMANMVESRDSNTGGHIRRTSHVVKILINEMKKSGAYTSMNAFFNAVVKAAPMHDLGKIAVEDAILRKPGKFETSEFEVMKTHSEKGAVIVENLLKDVESEQLVNIARNVAHYHHERWDGSGYPDHLKGNEIPLEARIMAIADVYDALVSRRCYKEKMSYSEAFDIITSAMGTQFDPALKVPFINCHKELEAYYESCGE
ncbi:HD domain-containing phosphohydrolase [Fibrobacter sp. UWEL]|uniref:HD domain-containing phosphohydrolase n=1 Tax=Fibrobacter sp. UWEL TaxID=1896209 RepID=UPI00091B4227|nr:HD domain-containing phosphohydrolase [Fibrobacter sp. UWEL]SHK56264.1 putative two-component system response regulator [Fibrobacter sp. UWEL]